MLRINTRVCDCSKRLELEGRLTTAYLPELERVVAEARGRCPLVILDLSELTFLDDGGVRLLRELQGEKVRIHGCSSFVAQLLGLR